MSKKGHNTQYTTQWQQSEVGEKHVLLKSQLQLSPTLAMLHLGCIFHDVLSFFITLTGWESNQT